MLNRLLLSFSVLFISQFVWATGSLKQFEITSGSLKVTQARCATGTCKSQSYSLSGTFSMSEEKGLISFPDSSLKFIPELEFELPEQPDLDTAGTTRKINYQMRKNLFVARGSEDNRAFDGPLYEYQFNARLLTETADFDTFNFYSARPDFRKCAAPYCGGYFIRAVNSGLTRCADGKLKLECYVADINYGSAPIAKNAAALNTNPLLVKGYIETKRVANQALGYFKAQSAYASLLDESATGSFVGVQNNGIVCVTSPCFSYDEMMLNSKRERKLSSIDFTHLSEQKVDIDSVWNSLGAGDVIIAVGTHQQTQDMVGPGLALKVNNVYLPLKKQ